MKMKFYIKRSLMASTFAMLGFFAFSSLNAQIYTDTTGLADDLEAGIFEEYILAPASVTDTFFIPRQITLSTDVTIKAQDGLGFKPVVTGNPDDDPSYLFEITDIDVGAEIHLEGVHITGTRNGQKMISNGTFKITAENVDLFVKDCDFVDIQGYNAIAKVFNSGGNITVENVVVHNCGGKIIQVNYKDDDGTPNYVPLMGDLTIKNSTIATIYKRIFFELGVGNVPIDENNPDLTERFNAGAQNVTIDHCTFYDFQGINGMQGRSFYDFIPGQTAIKNQLSITNTIFADMDENLNADSASQFVFDYNYIGGFGAAIPPEDLEDFSQYNPTNTISTAPVFADTTDGNWDLTLQNENDLTGSDAKPIGDPRWWKETPNSVQRVLSKDDVQVFSFENKAVIRTKEFTSGNIAVFNMTGQLVTKRNIASERTEIALPQGLYIVRVNTGNNSVARKVAIVSE